MQKLKITAWTQGHPFWRFHTETFEKQNVSPQKMQSQKAFLKYKATEFFQELSQEGNPRKKAPDS